MIHTLTTRTYYGDKELFNDTKQSEMGWFLLCLLTQVLFKLCVCLLMCYTKQKFMLHSAAYTSNISNKENFYFELLLGWLPHHVRNRAHYVLWF